MNITGSLPAISSNVSLLNESIKKPITETADSTSTDSQALVVVEGVKVSLSGAGLQKAADEKNDSSDLTESGLPDSVQKTLISIRELKQQIAEKLAELQALMADQSMTPEEKQSKIGAIQTTLATLNAGLMTANAALEKASKNGTLNASESRQAAVLAMKS